MQVIIKNGYVASYAVIGNIVGGIEIEKPDDFSHFENHYQAYKVVDNSLVFDESRDVETEKDNTINELRRRREVECFAIIDRSRFWFDNFTEEEIKELREWYEAWLNVTDTLQVPKKPNIKL